MLLDIDDSQLVLLDYQTKLMPVLHEGSEVLDRAHRLADLAALLSVPAVLTEHCADGLGGTAGGLKEKVKTVLHKTSFSAVSAGLSEALMPKVVQAPARGNARSLPKHLRQPQVAENERRTIVLAGCEAHVCVLQTALDLVQEEWDVWVVTDACASRTQKDRDAAYDRLAGAGVELVTWEMVAFEWLRDAAHPAFPQVLEIIKRR